MFSLFPLVFDFFFVIIFFQYLIGNGGTKGYFNFFPATLPYPPCMFASHMTLTPAEEQ